jgi:hypothetical protein
MNSKRNDILFYFEQKDLAIARNDHTLEDVVNQELSHLILDKNVNENFDVIKQYKQKYINIDKFEKEMAEEDRMKMVIGLENITHLN